ncbi:AcrR family transcriptional regulator [Amycolatopsis jiangsuensis]|uniref:AcrR family transcriptional regulator n=1 Tax=Amycolatopsis jiangsuensis TaxID=1181879 RepID=A0A840J3D1_9PSEU|nr:AcrR family transcriptional regulator [Amycolatopsis jiangsuensis]
MHDDGKGTTRPRRAARKSGDAGGKPGAVRKSGAAGEPGAARKPGAVRKSGAAGEPGAARKPGAVRKSGAAGEPGAAAQRSDRAAAAASGQVEGAAARSGTTPVRSKRADARRNEKTLLDAAAAVFVAGGVDAPVRDIAARAGVGMGTVYRHFPTRADLIIAVYRHQVEACAEAGPVLLADSASPYVALTAWIDRFVDFLVTKHGLAGRWKSDEGGFDALHAYFLDRLVPVCAELLDAAVAANEIETDLAALELMRGVGNLCIGAEDARYDARRLVAVLLAGLRRRP